MKTESAAAPGCFVLDRDVLQVSEGEEVGVEVVQLKDAGQQEDSRQEDACKQLHSVIPLQADVTQPDRQIHETSPN